MDDIVIRTSEPMWLRRLADSYRSRAPVLIIDDAGVGLDPCAQSLLQIGKRARLTGPEWAGVLVSLGMGGAGVWMVVAAVVDPEPTSKLGLLVAGGVLLSLGGGFSALRTLTRERPPTVELTRAGIRVHWESNE